VVSRARIGNNFIIHATTGISAAKMPASCFGTREPHYMFELIGSVVEEANMDNGAGMDSSDVRGVGKSR
jgi:hypothetical protein